MSLWTWKTTDRDEIYVDRGDGSGFLRPTLDPNYPGMAQTLARVERWTDLAKEIGVPNGTPIHWTLGVIFAESGGDPNAVSSVGARGLMQVMPATAAGLGYDPATMFSPAPNIGAGTTLLGDFRANGFDFPASLSMYNAGPGGPPMRPKLSTSSPWGYVENEGYILNAVMGANYFRRKALQIDFDLNLDIGGALARKYAPLFFLGLAYIAMGGKTYWDK